MPKIPIPLTATKIKNAKPREKDYTLSDGRGLYLLVKSTGSKLWLFIFTSPLSYKRRKTSIGGYPKVSLKEARKIVDDFHSLIVNGIDPIEHRRKLKAQKSGKGLFKSVSKEWLDIKAKEMERGIIQPKTFQKMQSLINFTNEIIGDIPIQNLKHFEVSNVIREKSKTAPVLSKRLLQYLNKIWLFAISRGYTEYNIIQNIDKEAVIEKSISKHQPCIDDEHLPELINSIYSYQGHISTRNALKLVLHIPLRAKNLVTLKWKYIDFEKRLLTIPREEMKVKDKNLKDFTLPLSDEVIKILQEQYQHTFRYKYVFVTDNGSHINPETPNKALSSMGFDDESKGKKHRIHGFRALFRSMANTHSQEHNNISYEAREAVLDHQVGSKTERDYTYKSKYDKEIKELLEWWSGFIANLLEK